MRVAWAFIHSSPQLWILDKYNWLEARKSPGLQIWSAFPCGLAADPAFTAELEAELAARLLEVHYGGKP
jgi:hypothetical protein